MHYKINRLDGRHSYRDSFQYYIEFSASMTQKQGPVHFNRCMTWFINTYGWSAEIRQYHGVTKWIRNSQLVSNQFATQRLAQGILSDTPEFCNPNWSWSNGMGTGLRIYLASDKELGFFTLAHPITPA
jgi:hypothetical protein